MTPPAIRILLMRVESGFQSRVLNQAVRCCNHNIANCAECTPFSELQAIPHAMRARFIFGSRLRVIHKEP